MSYDATVNQINSIQSTARATASSAMAAATAMVNQALGTLTGYTPDFPQDPLTPVEVGIRVGGTDFEPTQKPPSFPTIRTAQDVTMGELGHIDTLDDAFAETAPTLNIPSFSYASVTPLAPFSGVAPTIDTTFTVPDAPELDEPTRPELLALRTDISVPTIDLPAMDITLPARPQYSLSPSFVAQFAAGQAAVPNPDVYGTNLVSRFFPDWLATIQQFEQRVNGVLAGTQTALTDAFDGRLYNQLRARISAETDKALAALDQQTTSTGWNLPGPARSAIHLRIRSELQAALNAAALEVYTKRTEREVQHLQYVLGQALPLHQAAVSLFSTAFDMSVKAFDGAMQYADLALKFAIQVYQTLQRDFEIDQMFVDKQIAILKEAREGEFIKLRVTEAELKVESLKSDHNKDRLTQFSQEIEAGNQRIARYDKQILALEKTLEGRELPLKAFESNVRGYLASWQSKEGEYKDIEMRIRGDEAKTKGELAKEGVYKTKADVFSTVVGAKAKKIDGQIQRNAQILKEFEVKQDAELKLTQIDATVAENALDAYKAMAEVYIAESKRRLEAARLDFEETLANSKLKVQEREFEFQRQFKNIEIELTRVKAISELQLSAADVHGRNAAAAMSVMNTMAELSASASG